jgi:hypothetical protein
MSPGPIADRGNEEAASSLSGPGEDADPAAASDEITRILSLPCGAKPFRSVIDYRRSGVEIVSQAADAVRTPFLRRVGFGQLLQPTGS